MERTQIFDDRHLTIQQRFDRWVPTPDGQAVYRSIVERANDLRARGWSHFGMRCLWEIARFDRSLHVGPEGGFKMNDHYHSRMARYIMERRPEFAGFFETRELKA